MTCHLSKRAFISSLNVVKNALNFGDINEESDSFSVETWNSGWEVDDTPEDRDQDIGLLKSEDHSWIQECVSSLSPALDVLVLAYEQHAVFLASKYDVSEESNTKLKFFPSFEGRLSSEKNESITCSLCLPLASQKRSLPGGPDWTCVIIGYSSGFIKIYTEKGELLFSQLLHEEPVTHLRCKTFVPQHFANYSDQLEELVIVYSSVVVTIDGFGLFQTLRACRNQLARAAAGKQELSQPPPLAYKKWGFQEHDKLMDCEAAGTLTTSIFDHLVTESIRKGFYGAAKANLPSNSLLVTTGSTPYVGFCHAAEGSSQLLLTDVVQAVASKLMNFLSHPNASSLIGGLMGRGHESDQQKNKPKIEPPTVLPLRFGLYDKRRQGISIALSPNKVLAAINDAFGRVILFDIHHGIAVRMWKGYRDAQCGWIEVENDLQKKESADFNMAKKKHVFFLVIYAPRRGILEVWCTQQGPRVAAFNVGKSGRLFSPGYSVVGGNFSTGNLMKQHLSACYFLDTDGYLKKVVVPFHYILSERNNKRIRDLHLLKELRLSLKNIAKGKTSEIIKILKDMKISNIRMQAINNVLSSRYSSVDLVETVISSFLSHLEKQDPEKIDHEMKLLKQNCVRAQQLIKLFKAINEINTRVCANRKTESSYDVQLYASSLCISEAEVGRILSIVALHQSVVPVMKKHVRFLDDNVTDMSFPDFVTCFNVSDSHLVKTGDEVLSENLPINLSGNISVKQMESLGGFLFHTSVHFEACLSSLQIALKESGIIPEKLLMLLLHHWVSDSGFCENVNQWLNLQQVMKHISSLSDPKTVSSESDHISLWWKSVRDIFIQSTGNVAAYIGAIVARSVSVIMANSFHVEQKNIIDSEKASKDKAANDDSDWESVSLDLEHWNLLIRHLEDILLLSILLKSQPYNKGAVRDVNISISSIVEGGQGMVTDLVAVWIVFVGLQPELLSSFFEVQDSEDVVQPLVVNDDKAENHAFSMIKRLFNEIRKKFSSSLDHDVLLANCAWEHLMQWNKNKDSTDHLTNSLCCLNLIRRSIIKNGFASMMWKSCLQKKFETLALLIEKVGKMPKERLCRKELEMDDHHLEKFIDFCCQILNIILETNRATELEEVPEYSCEDLWQDRENHGHLPLILMALGQKLPTTCVVYQHLLLSTILHLIISFQMKSARPLGLFSTLAKKTLFRELHCNIQVDTEKEDSSLQNLRTQFLLRAISSIAHSVPENMPDDSTRAASHASGENVNNLEGRRTASKWFNQVIDLARDWDLDLDELRRHYVCELYSGGHDALAEEIRATVADNTLLSSQLLLLVGQRVHKLIYDSSDPADKLGYFSPELTTWLKSLSEMSLRCNIVPLHSTVQLVDHILASLPEGHREQTLAQSLNDALKSIVETTEAIQS